MNESIERVFANKDEIINKTMNYQQINTSGTPHNHVKERVKLCDYFDKNFSDDEIMVIQSIMYFGRECFCHDNYNYGDSVDEIISYWMKELRFSFGKRIRKNIEIHQMVEKGLKIGTYFKYGFENLK